jgi:hypothetical protein
MAGAGLVVIRLDEYKTVGLRWELACAREDLPPEKVVLWFPSEASGAGYEAIRQVVHEAMRVDLPEACHRGFVTFDADWQQRPAANSVQGVVLITAFGPLVLVKGYLG